MIELGRHRKIPKELRFYQVFPNKVETDAHFPTHVAQHMET